MRVLVHGLVGTNLGGIETFLLNMNDAMGDDCIFDYVIEEKDCIHEKRINAKGGKIYKITSRADNVQKHIKDIKKLYKEVKGRYSVIYYNLSSASWIIPEIIAKLYGYQVVVHSHNAMLIDVNSGLIYRIANNVNRFVLGHMKIKRLACSKIASEFIFGKAESTIIYNGIDVEKYRYSEEVRSGYRKKLYIADDDFVVGVVGRLEFQKNPLFSLEIFNKILKKRPDSKLIMVGEGNLRKNIEDSIKKQCISDKVILTGIIDNVYMILNTFDVFLLPSRHEGLGIALIEAQANGLPCFTSKDVVPDEAKVTELLQYISLEKNADEWARLIMDTKMNIKREAGNEAVLKSKYCINNEAKRLEEILNVC